ARGRPLMARISCAPMRFIGQGMCEGLMASSGRLFMESRVPESRPEPGNDDTWESREQYWKRKLGRLRLGGEPLEEQLALYRRATLVLTDICAVLALFFIGLFAAFRRPDIGAILALVLLGPIVALAWLDHGLLARKAARFLREQQEYQKRTTTPRRT